MSSANVATATGYVWAIVEPTGAPDANQGPNTGDDLISAAFTVTSVQPTIYSIAPNPATVGEGAGTLVFTFTRAGGNLLQGFAHPDRQEKPHRLQQRHPIARFLESISPGSWRQFTRVQSSPKDQGS